MVPLRLLQRDFHVIKLNLRKLIQHHCVHHVGIRSHERQQRIGEGHAYHHKGAAEFAPGDIAQGHLPVGSQDRP